MSPTSLKPLKRILVANRGEIALRIIRACREMGIESVAVYSDADANSRHVSEADLAINLPGTASKDTYLNVPALIQALRDSKADALHPGFGFLSENADFAEAVGKAGVKFIGPSPAAMRAMGDKVHARNLMTNNHVPVVPGAMEAFKDAKPLKALAEKIGFPLILKASGGGGGRGMRIVRAMGELEEAFAACTREAISYFGNPDVFAERYIEHPRHIEVQVLFDEHGNGIHLFERDCSIQRRHQKLVEEAPSCFLTEKQRNDIGEIAVRAGKAAGYASAGTIEFICESPEKIYFMEMNTRIQVEHPVTELISGVDLIQSMIRVAQGETLPWKQSDIVLRGAAIEVRINAEDATRDFLPDMGTVDELSLPLGPGMRCDTHIYPGYKIPSQYDSMLLKVIAWAEDRPRALARMRRALAEMRVTGVQTTMPFHRALLDHKDFKEGHFTTRFIEENVDYFKTAYASSRADTLEDSALVAAILAQEHAASGSSAPAAPNGKGDGSLWQRIGRMEGLR